MSSYWKRTCGELKMQWIKHQLIIFTISCSIFAAVVLTLLPLTSCISQESEQSAMSIQLSQLKTNLTKLKLQLTREIARLERNTREIMHAQNAAYAELDYRLALIEESNYDGTLTWRVPHFSQHMEEARGGKHTSIFSLPFYTDRYGYKMCLRLDILGDGIGKGTHMSLFFVLMRGEFDNVLQWPFNHSVSLRLISQTGGDDITNILHANPVSSSFKKPETDMNTACGFPRFISHDDLLNGGFIVEDTIFIYCSVN